VIEPGRSLLVMGGVPRRPSHFAFDLIALSDTRLVV
jgi:hypothetical protein